MLFYERVWGWLSCDGFSRRSQADREGEFL